MTENMIVAHPQMGNYNEPNQSTTTLETEHFLWCYVSETYKMGIDAVNSTPSTESEN